jgi:hypothetical protein
MAMIDSFNNINELSSDDGRIVRANFTLKLQGYVVPDNVQKKLKEQNTRYFSKAQIVLNQATTVIEEPSTRSKVLRGAPVKSTGGSTTNINTNTTNTGIDDDWQIIGEVIKSNRDVEVTGYVHLNFDRDASNPNINSDLFLIQDSGNDILKVNNDGVLVFKNFNSLPAPVAGGLLIQNNELYLGID